MDLYNFYVCTAESAVFTTNQLESCRLIVTRIMRKQKGDKKKTKAIPVGKAFARIPKTHKAKNARMGKGKGGIYCRVYRAKAFSPLFILRRVNSACAYRIGTGIRKKLNHNIVSIRPRRRRTRRKRKYLRRYRRRL